MSNTQFPDLRGLAWDYTLTPTFSTGVQQATSGREVRVAFWSAPLWKLSLGYEFLHDDAQHVDQNGYSQLQQLAAAGEFGLAVTVGQNREIAERTEGSIAKSRQRRSRAGQVNALESRHCTATMPLGRNWDHDKID